MHHRTAQGPALKGRILVVEQTIPGQLQIADPLASAGYACEAVGNREQALYAAQHRPYDLVILGPQIWLADGPWLARQIRLLQRQPGPLKRLPIMAMTPAAAKAPADIDAQCKIPVDPVNLLRALDDLLNESPGTQSLDVEQKLVA
jgi:CheY-like chemotaxis protein